MLNHEFLNPIHSLSSSGPEWIYSQGFYFEPRTGGEVRIFGCYNNKRTNKEKGMYKYFIERKVGEISITLNTEC